jgi:hypothetical protein
MTADEAYEKYKHLDQNLSDKDLVPGSFWGLIIFDLWEATKNTLKERPAVRKGPRRGRKSG